MREVGVFSAKTHLSQLLDSVSHGESFAITRHGQIIALLTPAKVKLALDCSKAIIGITALRKKIAKRGMKMTLKEIQSMKDTGRR